MPDKARIVRVCLTCAARGTLRHAVISGACDAHRDTVPADAPAVMHEWIVAEEATP